MIRVAIADDHAVVREGLKRIIDNEARLELVGEAADGHEALKMLQAGNLDVLILDMSMPGRSGIELISLIKRESPRLPILVLSMHSEEQFAVRAIPGRCTRLSEQGLRIGRTGARHRKGLRWPALHYRHRRRAPGAGSGKTGKPEHRASQPAL